MAVAANNIEDTFGDGDEYPVDDAGIHPAPLAIAVLIRSGGVDVTLEAEFTEGGLEEQPPLAVVGVVHVENDRNVVADRDPLDGGSRGGATKNPPSEEESETPEWLEPGAIGAAEEDVVDGFGVGT